MSETEIKSTLDTVRAAMTEAERFRHACRILNFDMETICPRKGMEEQGDLMAFLDTQAFRLVSSPEFQAAAETLYTGRASLCREDRALAEQLHRQYLQTRNITPEMNARFGAVFSRAYVRWLEAKEKNSFECFVPALQEVRTTCVEMVRLREHDETMPDRPVYDQMLSDYERGTGMAQLDACFEVCKARLLPLLRRICKSTHRIRTDFLYREVSDAQQKELAQRVLEIMGFDFERGSFTTTEHPFTDGLGRNDIRVTTHYDPHLFISSMYSVIHEGGHALFEQLQPSASWEHFIQGGKSMGMHESVSRFYENRIGRSRAFIALIYPTVCEIFPQVMHDVSEQELYEAVNQVQPSLIRTEADEFTYTLHIIIRYELEKEIVEGKLPIEEIPKAWREKYNAYLGIEPQGDADGALQDVHWSSGFGYFPTYALGNMYNAMYVRKMNEDLNLDACIRDGNFGAVNTWMQEHVFQEADLLSPGEWIRKITGRDLSPDDFLDYLEEKYTALYEL